MSQDPATQDPGTPAVASSADDAVQIPEAAGTVTSPSADRIKNPWREHGHDGRVPYITPDLIGRTVEIGTQPFDRRSTMLLREFQQNSEIKHDLYPRFLNSGRVFSVLIDGYKVTCTEILGYGRFGLVFKASIADSSLQVAMKFMFKENRKVRGNSAEFKKARKLPQKLFDSGRIIYYLALCDMAPYMNSQAELIIMELAENGDLFDSIVVSSQGTQRPLVYTANHARRLTIMVIEAMATLREHGYLHRDLKAENLLFNKFGQMVLGDIGNIKDLEGGTTFREVGTKSRTCMFFCDVLTKRLTLCMWCPTLRR